MLTKMILIKIRSLLYSFILQAVCDSFMKYTVKLQEIISQTMICLSGVHWSSLPATAAYWLGWSHHSTPLDTSFHC